MKGPLPFSICVRAIRVDFDVRLSSCLALVSGNTLRLRSHQNQFIPVSRACIGFSIHSFFLPIVKSNWDFVQTNAANE